MGFVLFLFGLFGLAGTGGWFVINHLWVAGAHCSTAGAGWPCSTWPSSCSEPWPGPGDCTHCHCQFCHELFKLFDYSHSWDQIVTIWSSFKNRIHSVFSIQHNFKIGIYSVFGIRSNFTIHDNTVRHQSHQGCHEYETNETCTNSTRPLRPLTGHWNSHLSLVRVVSWSGCSGISNCGCVLWRSKCKVIPTLLIIGKSSRHLLDCKQQVKTWLNSNQLNWAYDDNKCLLILIIQSNNSASWQIQLTKFIVGHCYNRVKLRSPLSVFVSLSLAVATLEEPRQSRSRMFAKIRL